MTRSLPLLALLACAPTTADGVPLPSPPYVESDTDTDIDTDTDTDTDADTGDDTAPPVDADGDGYPAEDDCDDGNPEVNPGEDERCNGKDDDCDGSVDEGLIYTLHEDADGDGHGDPDTEWDACYTPDGWTVDATDCDDDDATSYPGAAEDVFDGADNDCDGDTDECDGAPYLEFTAYEYATTGGTAVLGKVYGEGTVCGHQCDRGWATSWISLSGSCSPPSSLPLVLHLEWAMGCVAVADPGYQDLATCTIRTSDGDVVSTVEVY